MTERQVEDVFDYYGLSSLYTEFRYPLQCLQLFDEISPNILEDFFDAYELETFTDLTFEEFCFSFMSFNHIHQYLPYA
ncbi:hypothetical protein FZC66_04620 [Priestia megaterium]|nr:hypothetical protein FZC66_04620 [Priestia megaterium]